MAYVPPFIEVVSCENINIIEATEHPGHEMAQIEFRDIRRSQKEDEVIERWRKEVLDKKIPSYTYQRRHQHEKELQQFHNEKRNSISTMS